MNENGNDKLILAVLQGDDYAETVAELNRNGFSATLLSSTGGFLKKKSTTVMIGVPREKLEDALIREVGEESGLIVIPESIRPIGEIVERRRDLFEKNKIYVCHSCFFFCDAKAEMTQTHMTESEIEKGFHLEWATAQEIIDGNEPFCETQPWSFRDREFVKMLVEKKILTT